MLAHLPEVALLKEGLIVLAERLAERLTEAAPGDHPGNERLKP